ncbi:hypothetical protein PFNF135_03387 [Plasmodium falciparum NF135/5.C10]|nr:hypothetical protein PFFVO_05859 [Plasmodium falciparum Vietnam Oak-Knoll (FVO)]ETW41888.1 hypothetical protein PFNF135_03387 [Plasmodium falciparum NF135/5.C10]
MKLAKWNFSNKSDLFFSFFHLRKNRICSLNTFSFLSTKINKTLLKSEEGLTNLFFLHPLSSTTKEVNMNTYKSSTLFFNNFMLYDSKDEQSSVLRKQSIQELLFKNKKTKLALRRKRKRMGERISLRYR